MDNFRERRSDNNSRGGKRERKSFNPNFNSENRVNSRSRYNNQSEGRPQFARTERRGGFEQGGGFGRYKSQNRAGRDFAGDSTVNHGTYNSSRYQSSPSQQGASRGTGAGNRGNYGSEQRPSYGNRGTRKAYDPNAKYSAKKRIVYKEAAIDPNAPVRLNKYLANAGICSRREADNYIEAGLVTVNGVVVTELGTKITPGDDVRFNSERINPERKVYVLLNKPKDCVTTVDDPQERKTVLDCLRGIGKERIYPVGRLDRNTTGVLLLTNDGDLASKLTHPKFMKKKVYHVTCDKNVAMSDMDLLVNGIELEDGHVYADEVTYVNEADRSQIGIEIHSGKNRIVRRMMEHLGYKVQKLDRVLFAGLTKKNLKRGDWRYLTEKEVAMLRMGAYE